jgi:hypothetical protein
MNIFKKWYLHWLWVNRYRQALNIVIRNEDLYPDFYEHSIEYWIQKELKILKNMRYESKV